MTESQVAVLASTVSRLVDQTDRLEKVVGELREHSAGGPFVQQSVYVLQIQSLTDSIARVGNHIQQLDHITYDNRENKLAVADFDAYKAAMSSRWRYVATTLIATFGASGWAFLGHR